MTSVVLGADSSLPAFVWVSLHCNEISSRVSRDFKTALNEDPCGKRMRFECLGFFDYLVEACCSGGFLVRSRLHPGPRTARFAVRSSCLAGARKQFSPRQISALLGARVGSLWIGMGEAWHISLMASSLSTPIFMTMWALAACSRIGPATSGLDAVKLAVPYELPFARRCRS